MLKAICSIIFLLLTCQEASAWGKRGHSLVNEAAAYLLAAEAPYMKEFSFDLGYYGNVPDLLWKRPQTYSFERGEHFINFEIFERMMGKNPEWLSNRVEFFKKYEVPENAGRAPWRVVELFTELQNIRTDGIDKKQIHELQKKWLSLAGILGHYVADLSQPLHVTENHDGQLTDQKGLHSFYEIDLVDELYPNIAPKIFQAAQAEFKKMKKNKEVFELALDLVKTSLQELKVVLATDKKAGRKSLTQAAIAHEESIVKAMARGAATLAVIWSKALNTRFESEKFFLFDESPQLHSGQHKSDG